MARAFKTGITADGDVSLTGKLFVNASAGDEGGEIFLNKPVTGTSISGGVNIDVYQNKLRIWEDSGTNRGVYIDMTAAGAGVGTNLLTGGGGGSGTVTSVAMTVPTGMSISGSPITSSGTLAVSLSSGYSFLDSNSAQTIAGNKTFSGHLAVSDTKQSAIATSQTSTSVANTWGANKVVMTAGVASALQPTLRPDGSALQAGDIWITW